MREAGGRGRLNRTGWSEIPMVQLISAMLGIFLVAPAALAQQMLPPRTPGDSAETAAVIADLWNEWMEAYERGDAEANAWLFMEEGIYAANTGQLLRGRSGIQAGVRGWVAARPRILSAFDLDQAAELDLETSVLRFRAVEDLAYGLYRFTIRVQPSRCLIDIGHALIVWRKQFDGGWRIESQIVNRYRDPPDDACAHRVRRRR